MYILYAKQRTLLFLLLLFFSVHVNLLKAQTCFHTSYGKTQADEGYDCINTADGGYIYAGSTKSFGTGNDDFFLVKVTEAGVMQWSMAYGGNNVDVIRSIRQCADGSYLIAGYTISYGPSSENMFILKISSSGVVLWNRIFGVNGSEKAFAAEELSDGSIVLAGNFNASNQDVALVKINSSGTLVFSKTYGGSGDDYCYAMQIVSDGIVLAGETASFGAGGRDGFVIKTDFNGVQQWSKTFGGTGMDVIYDVKLHPDGSLMFAGKTTSFSALGEDVWVFKTSNTGVTTWAKRIGSTLNEEAQSINKTTDGWVLAGTTWSFAQNFGGSDMYAVNIDDNGNHLWSRNFGGINDEYAYASAVKADGSILLCGSTKSYGFGNFDMYIAKMNSAGNGTCKAGIPPTVITTISPTVANNGSSVTQSFITYTGTLDVNIANPFDKLDLCAGLIPLAVGISSFDAQLVDKDAWLTWTAESTLNSTSFDIERSTNGLDFEVIQRMQVFNKTSGSLVFQWKDETLAEGVYYYRLKHVLSDQSFSFTDVKLVQRLALSDGANVYPNPVNNQASFSFSQPLNGSYTLVVWDAQGKQVRKEVLVLDETLRIQLNNVSDLPAGFYFLTLNGPVTIKSKMLKL